MILLFVALLTLDFTVKTQPKVMLADFAGKGIIRISVHVPISEVNHCLTIRWEDSYGRAGRSVYDLRRQSTSLFTREVYGTREGELKVYATLCAGGKNVTKTATTTIGSIIE